MPADSAKKQFVHALRALRRAFDATGAPWTLIGGMAVNARGIGRYTKDIDVSVRGDAVDLPPLMAALAAEGIEPRIPDATAFARKNLVILARHASSGVDLDISLAWSRFELEAIDASEIVRIGRVPVPTATPEDLVIFKALAARPQDVQDALKLLTMYPTINLRRVRETLAELAAVVDAPELVSGLEAIIKQARAARRLR